MSRARGGRSSPPPLGRRGQRIAGNALTTGRPVPPVPGTPEHRRPGVAPEICPAGRLATAASSVSPGPEGDGDGRVYSRGQGSSRGREARVHPCGWPVRPALAPAGRPRFLNLGRFLNRPKSGCTVSARSSVPLLWLSSGGPSSSRPRRRARRHELVVQLAGWTGYLARPLARVGHPLASQVAPSRSPSPPERGFLRPRKEHFAPHTAAQGHHSPSSRRPRRPAPSPGRPGRRAGARGRSLRRRGGCGRGAGARRRRVPPGTRPGRTRGRGARALWP